jgi:hypothetical protein
MYLTSPPETPQLKLPGKPALVTHYYITGASGYQWFFGFFLEICKKRG